MDGYPVGRTLKHGYHSIGGAQDVSMTKEGSLTAMLRYGFGPQSRSWQHSVLDDAVFFPMQLLGTALRIGIAAVCMYAVRGLACMLTATGA